MPSGDGMELGEDGEEGGALVCKPFAAPHFSKALFPASDLVPLGCHVPPLCPSGPSPPCRSIPSHPQPSGKIPPTGAQWSVSMD